MDERTMDEGMERNDMNDFIESDMESIMTPGAGEETLLSEQTGSEFISAEAVETVEATEIVETSAMEELPFAVPVLTEELPFAVPVFPEEPTLLSNGPEPVVEDRVTLDGESRPLETKKKSVRRRIGRKLAAACMVAILGGGSMGLGLSLGQRISPKLLPKSQATEASSFAFSSYALPVSQTTASTYVPDSDNSVARIVQDVSDSVVSINITGQETRTFYNQVYAQKGAGSGIIFSEDGDNVYIVTNYHVIDQAAKVGISIDDEKQASARYVGGDNQADIAVISVSKADLKEADITEYKVASFADSENLLIGETVLAIGNALGEGKTVTRGIVSAIKKQTALQDKTMDLIQTDAAINQGNSGGALVNMQGLVVGINTAKLAGNGIEGMGYSIPSNTVKDTANELLKNGTVDRPYLGVEVFSVTEDMQKMYDLPSLGAYIRNVVSGGSAEEAGLQASDIIVGFGDTKITKTEELLDAIAEAKTGDVVKVYIYRNGKTPMVVDVTIKNMNEKF